MSKSPSLTPKKLISFLQRQGFLIDHTSGSHVVLYNFLTKKRVIVPFHNKDIPKGTLFVILKSAGFSKDSYFKMN